MRRLGVSRRQLFEELDRPALAALAGRALRLRRVAAAPGRARLSRRGRRPLLLGAAPAAARAGRGAHHRAHGRAVPQGRARRRAICGRARGRHTTLAEHMPSSHRRHADWTIERIRREAAAIGPDTATLVDVILREPAPSRAGLPRLPRHPAARPPLRRRPARGGLRPRPRDRRPLLRLDQLDPAERPRPPAAAAACRRRPSCRSTTPTSAAPATTIEETAPAHPSHPRPARQLGLAGMARAFAELQDNQRRRPRPRRVARPAARPRDHRTRQPPAQGQAALRQAAPAAPPSRTSTGARRAASTARCSRSWPPAAGSRRRRT